jgi:hypothetical protein
MRFAVARAETANQDFDLQCTEFCFALFFPAVRRAVLLRLEVEELQVDD